MAQAMASVRKPSENSGAPRSTPRTQATMPVPLAVTGRERSPLLPNVATLSEGALRGYEASTWYGLLAPAKTPPDIIDRLNRSAAKAVQADAFKKLSVNEGLVLIAAPPQEFGRYYRSEVERWRKVIEDAGIKVE